MDASRDRLLDSRARRQHGAFSRRQVLELGFVDSMIHRRLASGEWLRLDEGVYALTSHPFTWRRQCMAATLAVPAGVIAGTAAPVLHDLPTFRPTGVELLVPRFARNARTPLATVRSASSVRRVTIDHIPCLPLPDTVVRLLNRISPADLAATVDHVLVARLATIEDLQNRFVDCVPRRAPGRGRLRELLESRGESGFVPATTQLERRLRLMLPSGEFVFEASPPWWPNGEGRVDAFCAPCRLIVEADGRRWHTREADFVRDRRRDNLAVAHGHAVLRFTYVDLRDHRDECRSVVQDTIAARTSHVS
jgi:very-short-patch-repair endonuclease